MKRNINYKNIDFYIANYTPRKNEYEKGLKYRLFVYGCATGFCFETIKQAKQFINDNYFIWI